MHKYNELQSRLEHLIASNNDFNFTEKEAWRSIISELANYQESVLNRIAASSSPSKRSMVKIHSGITSLDKNNLGKNYNFISVSDDIKDYDFPNGIIENYNKSETTGEEKTDGDWYIIGTGYLDSSYDEVLKLCGREHLYKGKIEDEEFEYCLVLKNNILHHEKMLLDLEKHYDIDGTAMYAPMLRRLVYIETKKQIKRKIAEADLQLEINGLSNLKGGWRAIWNIEYSDNPHIVKVYNNYRFERNSDLEYIIPILQNEQELKIQAVHDDNIGKDYVIISPYKGENPKKFIRKINISEINNEDNISDKDVITYITPHGNDNEIVRIYSKSDVIRFLKSYDSFIECLNVYTKSQSDFKIYSYEKGFEYPIDSETFELSGRPKLYVEFRKEEDHLFYDRVVYITYLLQKRFPEYVWKGGVIE